MKKDKNTIDLKVINLLITKWHIDRSLLAATIGMPPGTFNNKLNPAQPLYRFTPMEYLQVCGAIGAIGDELSTFYKHEGRRMMKLIEQAKPKKLS